MNIYLSNMIKWEHRYCLLKPYHYNACLNPISRTMDAVCTEDPRTATRSKILEFAEISMLVGRFLNAKVSISCMPCSALLLLPTYRINRLRPILLSLSSPSPGVGESDLRGKPRARSRDWGRMVITRWRSCLLSCGIICTAVRGAYNEGDDMERIVSFVFHRMYWLQHTLLKSIYGTKHRDPHRSKRDMDYNDIFQYRHCKTSWSSIRMPILYHVIVLNVVHVTL